MRYSIRFIFFITGLISVSLLQSCNKAESIKATVQYLEIPKGFPDVVFPKDNQFSKERWELGKKLFFDPVLSIDSTISCATCHKTQLAFADDQATTPGVADRPGLRNSPSLANVAYAPYLLREGSVPTLEMQVLVPIQEHNEFAHNIVDIMVKLQSIPAYVDLAKKAYNRAPDPFVITRALGVFERTILSGNSNYDKYINGNKSILSSTELAGMQLFNSARTNCTSCHSGLFFTNHSFENNGLYEKYTDSGRYRFTLQEEDRATFKTPSLRNVALTAPYMHDGSMASLEDVIAHYNAGGHTHPNKSNLIKPLNLTDTEKASLVAFLNSLTDYYFINDAKWQ